MGGDGDLAVRTPCGGLRRCAVCGHLHLQGRGRSWQSASPGVIARDARTAATRLCPRTRRASSSQLRRGRWECGSAFAEPPWPSPFHTQRRRKQLECALFSIVHTEVTPNRVVYVSLVWHAHLTVDGTRRYLRSPGRFPARKGRDVFIIRSLDNRISEDHREVRRKGGDIVAGRASTGLFIDPLKNL